MTDPELVTEPWLEDEMVVDCAEGPPLTGRPVSYDELNNVRWVLREEGSSSRNFFDTQLRQKLSSIHVNAELNSFDAIIRSVLVGLGLTYISRRVLTDPSTGATSPPWSSPDRFRRQLTFCRHADKYLARRPRLDEPLPGVCDASRGDRITVVWREVPAFPVSAVGIRARFGIRGWVLKETRPLL